MITRRYSWAGSHRSIAVSKKMGTIPERNTKLRRGLGIRKICNILVSYFQEYSENSSLHGIRYVGEKGRTLLERILWIFIFTLSIFACLYLILKTWDKWQTSPVIVSFAHKPTAVWQIPFPAVTICPEIKSRHEIFNYTKEYLAYEENRKHKNVTDELSAISLLCNFFINKEGGKIANENMIDFMHTAAPVFNETFMQCQWDTIYGYCPSTFSPLLTEEGLCYTFNMLDSSELFTDNVHNNRYVNGKQANWTLDTGYQTDKNTSYPYRALGDGHEASFRLLLNAYEHDFDYLCRGAVQGFKVLLHNPAEIPRVTQKYLRIPVNQELTISITPDMTQTSSGLKPYSFLERHCYFQNEKYLHFYKIYTADNCLMECLTNYTLQKCGCVAFYMPYSNDTKICGSSNIDCVAKARRELRLTEVTTDISNEEHEYNELLGINKCKCFPACNSLAYNAETSQIEFDWQTYYRITGQSIDMKAGSQLSLVSIFFKDTHFISSYRSELFGQTDFIANCGGLLGLFMGFSFVSLIEIIYFLTLRIWCKIAIHRRKLWSSRTTKSQYDASTDLTNVNFA